MKRIIQLSCIFAMLLSAPIAHALEDITGHVVIVEPTYMPDKVTFIMDTGNTTCPSNKWFIWSSSNPENTKAVYSTLITAMLSGKKIRFYIDDGDTSCTGKYIHLLN